MRCAIYARLSKNRGRLSENVKIQVAECEDYAADPEQGWTVVGRFSDDDAPASKFSRKPRPGYNALMASVRAGQVDVVLVTEMPRLYRRLEELLELIRLAESTPLRQVETTKGTGYRLATAEGIHNAVNAVNNATLESGLKSERVKRKLKANARQGHPSGRRPYGYDYTLAVRDRGGEVIEPGRLEVNEPEQAVIGEAVRLLLGGHSLHGTVAELNKRGHRTLTGLPWRTMSLRDILTSRTIVGERAHNGAAYPGTWPAILDREQWERVQLILNAEQRLRGAHQKGRRSYLLTGMIFCGACGQPGAPLVGFGHTVRGELERRYYCAKTDTAGQARGCGKVGRLADPIEALVSEAVVAVLDSPRMAEALTKAGDDDPEMAGLLEQYQGHRLKLDDLVDDYASGLLNREQLAHAKQVVEAALEATRAKLDRLQSGRALASVPVGQSIREWWAAADLDLRRQLVALVVERVIVYPGRPGGRRWPPDDSDAHKRIKRQWHFDPGKLEIIWRV